MACGPCQGGQVRQMMTTRHSVAGPKGRYLLASHPDCTRLYRGQYDGTGVFVVAPGGAQEKLFRWRDREAAQAYADEIGVNQIDSVAVSELCHDAVEALYAS